MTSLRSGFDIIFTGNSTVFGTFCMLDTKKQPKQVSFFTLLFSSSYIQFTLQLQYNVILKSLLVVYRGTICKVLLINSSLKNKYCRYGLLFFGSEIYVLVVEMKFIIVPVRVWCCKTKRLKNWLVIKLYLRSYLFMKWWLKIPGDVGTRL